MIAIIARMVVRPELADEFEAAMDDLAKTVRADEPGNRYYELFRERAAEATYTVVEFYDDDDAVTAHRRSAHFRAAGSALAAMLAVAPTVTTLDACRAA